jgi:hypothetical protein
MDVRSIARIFKSAHEIRTWLRAKVADNPAERNHNQLLLVMLNILRTIAPPGNAKCKYVAYSGF